MNRYGKLKYIFFYLLIFSHCFSSENKPLLKIHGYNVYSQWGEDGIIEKIFQIIGTESKNCIEFGATEGIYFSNTANLWKHKNWKAILIESNPKHYSSLMSNTKGSQCICLIEKIGISETDSLEHHLSQINFDEPIDLLSIDIDGNDYYVLNTLKHLRPRVIICEYNPSFPAHMNIFSKLNNFSGCSVGALNRVARKKGYTLICITDTNCFYINDNELEKFYDYDLSLESMRIDKYLKYVVTDYRGNYKIIGTKDSKTPYGFKKPTTEEFFGDVKCYENLNITN